MENEQITIKLSAEQLMEKQVQVEDLTMKLAHDEMNLEQFEEMIGNNFFLRQAQVMLNRQRRDVATLKHNIEALKIQIEKGEM